MTDEVISITQIENTYSVAAVYELLTDRLNHINDHIILYKVVDHEGRCNLTDDGYTLDELKMYGIKISGKTADRIDELLADHNVYRSVLGDALYTGSCSEDDLGNKLTSFLDAIEAVYKEFF